jgi:hypothetical protein
VESGLFYWLVPDGDKEEREQISHLDGPAGSRVKVAVYSLGGSAEVGIRPTPGDPGDAEEEDEGKWPTVIIGNGSLYTMKGSEHKHWVKLQDGAGVRHVFVVFFNAKPEVKVHEGKLSDLVPCNNHPGKEKYAYHDDATCVLHLRRGGRFSVPRRQAIDDGYYKCANCVGKTQSSDELTQQLKGDDSPDDTDQSGHEGADGNSGDDKGGDAADDQSGPEGAAGEDEKGDGDANLDAVDVDAASSDEVDGRCVEVRVSLIPGANKGLFLRPGVCFKKGDTVCRMSHQMWRQSKSRSCNQNPIEELKGDKDLPEGYINFNCYHLISHTYQVAG